MRYGVKRILLFGSAGTLAWLMISCSPEVTDQRQSETTEIIASADQDSDDMDTEPVIPTITDARTGNVELEREATALSLLALSKALFGSSLADTKGDLRRFVYGNDGKIIFGMDDGIYSYGEDGAIEKEGDWPSFFGSSDQLFFKLPIVDDELLAAWVFYHDDANPDLAKAQPAIIDGNNAVARPDLAGTGWKMPASGSDALRFASIDTLWFREGAELQRIRRKASQWYFDSVKVEEFGTVVQEFYTADDAYLVDDKGAIQHFVVAESTITKTVGSVPDRVKDEESLFVVVFEGHEVVIGEKEMFIRKLGTPAWVKMEQASIGVPTDYDGLAHRSSSHTSRIRVGESLVDISIDADYSGDVENYPDKVVPSTILAISSGYCETCHVSRATADIYEKASFDPRHYAHWESLVSSKGEADSLSVVLDVMCQNLPASVCDEEAENRQAITDWIKKLSGSGL